MDLTVPAAKAVNKYYDPMLFSHEKLKSKLDSLLAKFNAPENSPLCQFRDAGDVFNKLRKDSSRWHVKVCHCLDDLGLICANEAAKICLETGRLPYPAYGHEFSAVSVRQYNSFLEEVARVIKESLSQDYEMLLDTEVGCLQALQLGHVSPKLFELLKILNSFGTNQVCCLIFVERIITARVIDRFIKETSYLSHLNVSYLTGGSNSCNALTPKMQKETLDLFRSGKVNLLFTTNVAEEGLHIPECSCVIRFDLPQTVCSYVQSRGRARQIGSHYIVMIERGNIQHRDVMFNIIKSKHSMVGSALKRNDVYLKPNLCSDKETDTYCVEMTGATITADSSVNLIYRYCEKLPKDKYYTPRPTFQFTTHDGSSECTLGLPPNAAFRTLVGPMSRSNQKAKQLVCFDACKKLHQMGALDHHLNPVIEEPIEIELNIEAQETGSGAGTTKRKELHGTTNARALSGSWVHQQLGVTLQGYKLNFVCDQVDEKYGSFILLINATLDEDVGCVDINLYLLDKMVKASVSPCGLIQLNAEQVKEAKLFHELLFNGLFGKLIKRNKTCGVFRKFLLEKDDINLWDTSNMYMLLPLEPTCMQDNSFISINWKEINACASVVRFLRSSVSLGLDCHSVDEYEVSTVSGSSSIETECDALHRVHLADKSVNIHSLKDMVVFAIHTGKIYIILDVLADRSASAPFETSEFSTYDEYFKQKYRIALNHPGQPLLLLKNSYNSHNLLSSKSNCEGDTTSKSTSINTFVKKPQNIVVMPPELLVHLDLALDSLKSFYLLPSLMHRMEGLMLASQLRKKISYYPTDSCISSSLILEAITTLRCCEDFSSERLELLGDSVLKYVMSSYLYFKFQEKHEGQLSSFRSQIVCNATLHKLGIHRNLQGYVRDAAFEPRRWVAPGQISKRPSPCNCDVNTSSASSEIKHATEDKSIVIGKACDKGHRWICSKTISDCVEALIGAYYVGGGLSAAHAVLKWLGISVEIEHELVEKAKTAASLWNCTLKIDELEDLEQELKYKFNVKGLLLEAITHASLQEFGASYCYQRLEFLGDSLLDLLITCHLYKTHKDIDPGDLTDLRSSSVNNENFAHCAVRHDLHKYLQHASGLLSEQITDYVNRVGETSSKGPKVLGDMIESIAGAILVDTELNLNRVWEVFEALLSPIATPRNLELPRLRELNELCSQCGYFLNTKCSMEGNIAVAKISVQLEKIHFVRKGSGRTKKAAKAKAALLLLKDLQKHGISRTRDSSKFKLQGRNAALEYKLKTDTSISTPPRDSELTECDMKLAGPVELSVKMEKGGPRTALYMLCHRSKWPRPRFDTTEQKFSAEAATKNGGTQVKNVSPYFVSKITLSLPDSSCIKFEGEMHPDKKSAQDSAALILLFELQKQGKCCIKAE